MTPDELRTALKALGMTQRRLASDLGVDTSTVWRWMHGVWDVPQYATAYLEARQEIERLKAG